MQKLLSVVVVLLAAGWAVSAEIKPDISGQAWFRYEGSDNTTDFNNKLSDSAEWSEYLIRMNMDFKLTDNTRLYVSPQFWGVFGAGSSTGGTTPIGGTFPYGWQVATTDDMQLFEGYVTVKGMLDHLDLKVGRQTLVLGNGLMVGNPNFYGGQAFDGVRLDYNIGETGTISLFDMKLREGNGTTLKTKSADDASLYGLYSSWNIFEGHKLDAYILYWRDRMGTSTGLLKVPTLGVLFMKPKGDKGFDYSAEIAVQKGKWDGPPKITQKGRAFEGLVGYTFESHLRLGLKTAYYSGGNGKDSSSDFFFNPGMDYYARYGRYDYLYGYWMTAFPFDSQGAIIGVASLDYSPNDKWAFGANATWFGVAERETVSSASNPRKVATEGSVYAKYKYNDHLSWLVSGSYLSPNKVWLLGNSAAKRGYVHAQVTW